MGRARTVHVHGDISPHGYLQGDPPGRWFQVKSLCGHGDIDSPRCPTNVRWPTPMVSDLLFPVPVRLLGLASRSIHSGASGGGAWNLPPFVSHGFDTSLSPHPPSLPASLPTNHLSLLSYRTVCAHFFHLTSTTLVRSPPFISIPPPANKPVFFSFHIERFAPVSSISPSRVSYVFLRLFQSQNSWHPFLPSHLREFRTFSSAYFHPTPTSKPGFCSSRIK